MGRHDKEVLDGSGLDRRRIGYYATPDFVASYVAERLLSVNPSGHMVFDPCVGGGEMVAPFVEAGKTVVGMDIHDYQRLQGIEFVQEDFLRYFRRARESGSMPLPYDYFTANPPYNCHESDYIRQHKSTLTHLFSGVGVLNMYSMFLAAMIQLAKPGAAIGVIINDSFLTSKLHRGLRELVLKYCRLHDLILCPTDLFRKQEADVRTCIMVLERLGRDAQTMDSMVRTQQRPSRTSELRLQLDQGKMDTRPLRDLVLSGGSDQKELVVGCPETVMRLFSMPRLGDYYPCVTGISTGCDARFVSSEPQQGFSVPFYKNPGSRRFFSPPDGYLPNDFLELSEQIPNFTVRNKRHLFSEGIACSSMGVAFGACYRPEGSVFGVNANLAGCGPDLWWLLAYLNSSLVTYLVRGVLLRSNMITSGYVSRIPLLPLTEQAKDQLSQLAVRGYRQARKKGTADTAVSGSINALVFREAGLYQTDIDHIERFCSDVVRRT